MNDLTPLETLFETERGSALPLPPDLLALYGQFHVPQHPDQPYVIGNFVTTLDGVVALNEPDHTSGGGEISGFNPHDQMVMGLLRAAADSIIVGAGTLRSASQHLWTAQYIYPPQADAYSQLRASLGKASVPLNVIVTARGDIDPTLPIFQSGNVPVLLVTTEQGAERLRARHFPASVQVETIQSSGSLSARAILQRVTRQRHSELVLVEGGPQLLGDFFAEQTLDELFLTLAPQIAGRDEQVERSGLVMGKRFAPVHPLWGSLVGVKRSNDHLFLRYAFEAREKDER